MKKPDHKKGSEMEEPSMMRWLLTTRTGFFALGLQMIATAAAQAYLHTTGDPHPATLALPVLLVPVAFRVLLTNWLLRRRYCRHGGGRAIGCWPECTGTGRTVEHRPDGGTQ